MKLIQWDAYDYVGDYVDVLDWRTSFFFYNERQTLIKDIEEKILKHKAAAFDCDCEGQSARLIIASGEAFVTQIIDDLESNFIIRQLDDDYFRIDQMPKNNIEIVTFVRLSYVHEIN